MFVFKPTLASELIFHFFFLFFFPFVLVTTLNSQQFLLLTMGICPKVILFPWDPKSDAHRKRLVAQRVECTWDQDKVEPKWTMQQLKGEKCIYWIVSFIRYSYYLLSYQGNTVL